MPISRRFSTLGRRIRNRITPWRYVWEPIPREDVLLAQMRPYLDYSMPSAVFNRSFNEDWPSIGEYRNTAPAYAVVNMSFAPRMFPVPLANSTMIENPYFEPQPLPVDMMAWYDQTPEITGAYSDDSTIFYTPPAIPAGGVPNFVSSPVGRPLPIMYFPNLSPIPVASPAPVSYYSYAPNADELVTYF